MYSCTLEIKHLLHLVLPVSSQALLVLNKHSSEKKIAQKTHCLPRVCAVPGCGYLRLAEDLPRTIFPHHPFK